MPQPVAVQRVLGDRPFAEIGEPRAVAVDEDRGLIAIGGRLGWLHWAGACTAATGWQPHVLGIYDRSGLRCRTLLRTRWPIWSLDFHPRQPLLAIGTGSYDGGWSFHGELLLLNLDSGETVSPLAGSREVRAVKWRTWRHGKVLDLALAPHDEFELGNDAMVIGFDAMVTRDDWLAVRDDEIDGSELDGPLRDSDIVSPEQARSGVEALSAEWSYRGPVWGVEQLRDGRILATMDGVRLESRLPSGDAEWAVHDECGRQLIVAPDQQSAWVTAPVIDPKTWYEPDLDVVRYSLHDGKVLDTFDPAVAGVVTARTDGAFALRPAQREGRPTAFFGPDRAETGQVELGGYDFAGHSFPIRHASALYFLRGDLPRLSAPRQNTWLVVVEDDLVVRPLFPFVSEPDDGEIRYAGPGVEVADSLVYSGSRPVGPVDTFVVRRRVPDGEVVWRLSVDHPVTAVEVDGSILYVALNSGELLGVDVDTGTVLWQQELSVHGHPTTALSLACAEPGRLLIGTVDGRILDCR